MTEWSATAGTKSREGALDSAQRSGQEVTVATALNNLGNIHRAQGRDRLARDCLARSIEVRERIADRPGLARSLNNLAQPFLIGSEPRGYLSGSFALGVMVTARGLSAGRIKGLYEKQAQK